MKSFKRAYLYVVRKRAKSLLLALIIFVISTLVLCGLAALSAEKKKSAGLRGTTGSSFSVEREEKWGDEAENSDNSSGITNLADFVTRDMIEKIKAVNGIKAYNALYETILKLSSGSLTGQDNQFRSYGSVNTEYASWFLARKLTLAEGRHITEADKNAVMISKDIAEKYGLKLGDRVSAVNDPQNNDPEKELTIVGIFEVLADEEDQKDQYSMDALYGGYSRYAFVDMNSMKELLVNYESDGPNNGFLSADFYVADPKQLESIVENVQKLDGIDWDNYKISVNDKVYERSADSMSDISSLIRTLIAVIIVISMFIVTLILSMWIKSRTRETGILLAAGITGPSILLQHIFEVALIALFSFPLSYFFSKAAAGSIGRLLESAGNVTVNLGHFAPVCIFGSILLLLAVLLSNIWTFRQKPREILSKMS